MKKFRLDLSEYEVEVLMPKPTEENSHAMGKGTQVYPLKNNISSWLRTPGVFHSGEEIAEAVGIAKQIRDCEKNSIELDERETEILKKGMNRLIELTAEGKANLGGPIHEEAICRVVKMQEAK